MVSRDGGGRAALTPTLITDPEPNPNPDPDPNPHPNPNPNPKQEDELFKTMKENDVTCQARGRAFLQWLCGRPEIHIAVVCHSVFLKNLLRQVRK